MNPLDKTLYINNKKYIIKNIINISLNYPIISVPTKELYRFIELNSFFIEKDISRYIKILKEKAMSVDLDYPIVLTKELDNIKILDGVNRITKAYFNNVSTLSCRFIPLEVL
jgi:hypothetical protein